MPAGQIGNDSRRMRAHDTFVLPCFAQEFKIFVAMVNVNPQESAISLHVRSSSALRFAPLLAEVKHILLKFRQMLGFAFSF